MQKIVINACHGGFGLNQTAMELFEELCDDAGVVAEQYSHDIARDCPYLVQVVETLGDRADTDYSELKIVEIPDGVQWEIHDYGGSEWIAEKHRVWSWYAVYTICMGIYF